MVSRNTPILSDPEDWDFVAPSEEEEEEEEEERQQLPQDYYSPPYQANSPRPETQSELLNYDCEECGLDREDCIC